MWETCFPGSWAAPGRASNQNVAAVAALSDAACVILTEGVQPDPDLLKKAQMQGINLLGTDKGSFHTAVELSKVLEP